MKTPASIVRKERPCAIRKTADAGAFEFVVSTAAPDREGDTIAPGGWRLAEFRRNPVVMWAHRYDEPPIGRARDVRVVGDALRAVVEFPPTGLYDKADTIRRLVEGGFLSATSVGFKPERWTYNERRGGTDFQEQTLLEFSIVSVPSNASALLIGPAKMLDRARLAAFFGAPRGSGLDFGADIGLEKIAADRPAALRGRDLDINLDAIPYSGGDLGLVTRAEVAAALREIVGEEVAMQRGARVIARGGMRGDGRRFNARTFQWERI